MVMYQQKKIGEGFEVLKQGSSFSFQRYLDEPCIVMRKSSDDTIMSVAKLERRSTSNELVAVFEVFDENGSRYSKLAERDSFFESVSSQNDVAGFSKVHVDKDQDSCDASFSGSCASRNSGGECCDRQENAVGDAKTAVLEKENVSPGISVGSIGHHEGKCSPCAFFHSGTCSNGEACNFCHLCPADEFRKQKKILSKTKAALKKRGGQTNKEIKIDELIPKQFVSMLVAERQRKSKQRHRSQSQRWNAKKDGARKNKDELMMV